MALKSRIDNILNQTSYSSIRLSTVMRWVVVIGILLRLVSHITSLGTDLSLWASLLLIYFLYTIAISIILIKNPKISQDKWIFFGQVLVDALFCAIFFVLSGNPESDLYLNLLLPLLVILENVKTPHAVLLYYFAWSLLMLLTLMFMVAVCHSGCTYQEVFLNTFIPRVTLYFFIILRVM
jgi:hypothetical protein